MIKIKKLLNELHSREYLQKILNNIKNNIDINEYLFDFDLPTGIYRRVLQKCKDVNIQDYWGETPLHWACKNNNVQMVKLLLQYPNININIKDNWDRTPLHFACRRDNVQIVKLLLQHPKININIQNEDKNIPEETTNNKYIKELFKKYRQGHQK